MKRRTFAAGLAALPFLGSSLTRSYAQAAAASLPKTYSGQKIRALASTGAVWESMATISREFTEATGVAVEYVNLSYNEQYQKLILDLTSGAASFDVFNFAYQWKYEIEPYSADLSNIATEISGAPDLALDDYPKRALDIYGRVKDKLVGLPTIGDVTLFVWNKEAYKAVGLDPAVGPKTWDEVAERGAKLVGNGQFGYAMPAGKGIQTTVTWILIFKSMGGEYFDASGAPTFGSEAGVKTMKFLVEKLAPISPPGNLTWDFPEMFNSLSTGQAGQSMMWPGAFGDLLNPKTSQVHNKIAWSPTPQASLLGGWAMGVNDSSRAKDAAKLYVAWLTSPDIVRRMGLNGGAPARISALKDPELVKQAPNRPAVLAGLQGDVAEYPPIKEAEQIHIMIYDEVNAAVAKIKTPEQAASDLQGKVESFMRRRGYLKT
ncbi:extracellular solute-binding protein [Ensifer aridi]|uniref:extracellular solute-binding protein n=1 Tax=Ensifer aridi TaxID=1708715 RepID=UPI000A100CD3|nr:extracellular solute-binding protein [Ensifer aridi]